MRDDEAELPSHLHLTAAGRRVLGLVALGRADIEVADLLDASPTAFSLFPVPGSASTLPAWANSKAIVME